MEKEFIEMLKKHTGILYKVSNLYCDDSEDKKDLFQEIVLQLWKSFPNFRKDAQASTWMYRIALNTAVSNFRKVSKSPERRAISNIEFEIPDITNGSEDNENLRFLKEAISKLSGIEKAIIILYLEEKSYDVIS